jgi:hypothetical protein
MLISKGTLVGVFVVLALTSYFNVHVSKVAISPQNKTDSMPYAGCGAIAGLVFITYF